MRKFKQIHSSDRAYIDAYLLTLETKYSSTIITPYFTPKHCLISFTLVMKGQWLWIKFGEDSVYLLVPKAAAQQTLSLDSLVIANTTHHHQLTQHAW